MVLQKRLQYGFNGYQVPPTPRAARSARKRVSSWKNALGRNPMCPFDLLATVAGKLLLEGDNSADKSQEKTRVSEIISKSPAMDSCSGLAASCITVSGCSDKVPAGPRSINGESKILDLSVEKVSPSACQIEDINDKKLTDEAPDNGPPPLVDNLNGNVNLVIRDDVENSFGCTQPPALHNKTFRPPPRIGDRRIRRLSASKQWKAAPKLHDGMHFNAVSDPALKPVCVNKKTCYENQRSLRDYPFKKRRLYELDSPSRSDDRSSSPRKGSMEDVSSLGATAQDSATQTQDSHVKLKIKSFRVPEFFIEIPETATVGSLKRTVMEAVTAIFSGELHVGLMLQGKKIRDDNKTLLQTGICHDNKLDALGFTLEPNQLQVPPSLCPEDWPEPLTRFSPAQMVANQVVIQQEVSDDALPDSPVTNAMNLIESDHDSAPSPSPPDGSVRSGLDSRALVTVPAMDTGALAVVPMWKSKQAEVAQRRIRRPFSVSEVEALVQAVEKLGTGRWRDVKLRAFDDANHRTYVDLKDKWKTLVHTARISPQQRRGEPVPQELLDRVLAAHGFWSHHQAKHQPQTEICRLL